MYDSVALLYALIMMTPTSLPSSRSFPSPAKAAVYPLSNSSPLSLPQAPIIVTLD